MPRPARTGSDFGARLAALRQARGLTQVQLAEMIGASQRVLSYYENHADYPPAHVLAALSRALSVSTDELLGLGSAPRASKRAAAPTPTGKMRRVLEDVAKLPRRQQEKIADVVAALVTQYEQSLKS